jgi:hypothetical protein
MSQRGNSYTDPATGEEIFTWWTLLEFSRDGMLLTLSLVQNAPTARRAAERSAGFQLGDGCLPRRIMVYEHQPTIFEWRQVRLEWRQVRPYIMEVGKEIGGVN